MEAIANAIAENLFWTAIFVLFVIWGLGGTAKSLFVSSQREKTRREIAAYVAEGSMTPNEGERLMRAVPDDAEDA